MSSKRISAILHLLTSTLMIMTMLMTITIMKTTKNTCWWVTRESVPYRTSLDLFLVCYLPNRHAVRYGIIILSSDPGGVIFACDGFLSSPRIMVLDTGVVKGYDAHHNYTCSEPWGIILLLMVFCPPPESWCWMQGWWKGTTPFIIILVCNPEASFCFWWFSVLPQNHGAGCRGGERVRRPS